VRKRAHQQRRPAQGHAAAAGAGGSKAAGQAAAAGVLALGEATNTRSYWIKRREMERRVEAQRRQREASESSRGFNHYEDGAGAFVGSRSRRAGPGRCCAAAGARCRARCDAALHAPTVGSAELDQGALPLLPAAHRTMACWASRRCLKPPSGRAGAPHHWVSGRDEQHQCRPCTVRRRLLWQPWASQQDERRRSRVGRGGDKLKSWAHHLESRRASIVRQCACIIHDVAASAV
jgi:hypothetical protein